MSQSPEKVDTSTKVQAAYEKAWIAIYELIDQGRSWSGRERNCCFLNTRGPRFADVSAATGLDLIDDGRAVALSDWDFDGRPDMWIVNRTGPRIRLLHNETRGNQHFVSLRLEGTECNRNAIGGRAVLYVGEKPYRTLHRSLRAGDGFIAQSSKWLHFGLGNERQIAGVVVHWPDGKREAFRGLEPDRHYRLVQGSGAASEWIPLGGKLDLAEQPVATPPSSGTRRTWIVGRVPLPDASYDTWEGTSRSLDLHRGEPLLVNLWSATCRSCLAELTEWKAQYPRLREVDLELLALSVDGLSKEHTQTMVAARQTVEQLGGSFLTGQATADLVNVLEIVHRANVERQRPLPVPSSVLIDRDGKVAAIYKGRVLTEQLIRDVRTLNAPLEVQRAAAVPFAGRWQSPPAAADPRMILARMVAAGQSDYALAYVNKILGQRDHGLLKTLVVDLHQLHGNLLWDRGQTTQAATEFAKLLTVAPEAVERHREIGQRLMLNGLTRQALPHLQLAARQSPKDVELHLNVAMQSMQFGEFDAAIKHFRHVLKLKPEAALVHFHLASALLAKQDTASAIRHFREAHRLDPRSQAANNLAWILATSRDDRLRNGPEAVKLAEHVCRQRKNSDPSALDTLAAAYAEVGRFKDAVRTIKSAIKLARDMQKGTLLADLTVRLRHYENRRPYRDGLIPDP